MPDSRARSLRYVLQKHAASRLHYDLRLELDGLMKSWALPRGPSRDPAEKRLAVAVVDHPISYNDFEGTIREGEYGAGRVIIWDRGTYETERGGVAAIREAFSAGRLSFTLHGKRLRGRWTLLRMHGRDRQWLLIKRRDRYAMKGDRLADEENRSVVSKRTLDARVAPASSGKTDGRRPVAPTSRSTRKAAMGSARRRPAQRVTQGIISNLTQQLAAIRGAGGNGILQIGRGVALEVSNLDKVYFPASGITKGDVMSYYVRSAPALLPLIANRPLILRRFPEGIAGASFFQHDAPENAPAAVRVELVPAEQGKQPRLIGGDLATLLYQVQLGAIEVNPWLSRVGSFEYPEHAVLDLDPGAGAPFARVVEVARYLEDVLHRLRLRAALKTSGKRGLHVYLPLPPRTTFERGQLAAKTIAERVAGAHPKEATTARALKKRAPGAVYVDYVQNDMGKSVAAPFSIRAKEGAPVSAPLAWDELTGRLDPAAFTMASVLDDLAARTRIWTAALRARNRLDHLSGRD